MRNRIFTCLAILLVAAGGVACDRTGNLETSVAVSSSLNNGEPYVSDAVEQGADIASTADDWVAEDIIPVEFYAKRYSDATIVDPSGEGGDILIERYMIHYTRSNGLPLPPEFANFQGSTSILVRDDKVARGSLVLLPGIYKTYSPIVDLAYGGGEGELLLTANYTFYTRNVSTQREGSFEASITVNVFDWVVTDDQK